jgi:hypothetical protein
MCMMYLVFDSRERSTETSSSVKSRNYVVRFHVLTVANINTLMVPWDIASCSLVEVD